MEPSLIVSNNDCTVKVFDIATHSQVLGLEMSGELKYNTPINHGMFAVYFAFLLVLTTVS